MPQPLSAKENSLFRQVIRNYEDKQYKKGKPGGWSNHERLLINSRYQGGRTNPQEKPKAWRYSSNESAYNELPGQDR